jgi:hypothetical protein
MEAWDDDPALPFEPRPDSTGNMASQLFSEKINGCVEA